MNRAYLSLGSNIHAEANIPAAVRLLATQGTIERVSRVWESAAAGDPDQPRYLNAAVLFLSPLSAAELYQRVIADIERQLHRVRDPHNRNAPRTIDIDVVLFNREVLRVAHRCIPDADILTRPFVAVPLAELEADYVHPETRATLAEIAAACGGARDLVLREDVCLLARGDVPPTQSAGFD